MHFPPPLPAVSVAISFAASALLLVLLVLVAIALSAWFYRYTVPEVGRGKRLLLTTLRAAALALPLFLLFEPVLNLRRTAEEPPRIAVLIDDSRSMTIADNGVERAKTVRELLASPALRRLSALGAASYFRFGGRALPLQSPDPDSLRFAAGETDIATTLTEAREELAERNLQAILLVTDGNSTTGPNPLHAAEEAAVPVFVIGIGDSAERKDLVVAKVLTNTVGYVESSIPVDASIRSMGYEGERVTVSLLEGGTVLERQELALDAGSREYAVSFRYTPRKEGMKKLTVAVSSLRGELTTENNRSSVFVKILKSKMKIAVVAGAPSPDLSFLEQVLRSDKNVEPSFFVQKFGSEWYGMSPAARDLEQADCMILAGFPYPGFDGEALRRIRSALEKNGTPLIILPARETDLKALRAALDPWLPFDIVQTRKEETQVFFEPAAGEASHPVISTAIPAKAWRDLPPLFRTESSFKARPGTRTLATMRINTVAFDEPLLVARSLQRGRVLAFTGYGLWRWRMASDVLGGRLPEILVANAVRWVTTREDEKRVRIRPLREYFDNGETAVITAQVYNESYEPVDDAEVLVRVRRSGGTETPFELQLSSMGAGRYIGSLEGLPEGDYVVSGEAKRDGTVLGSDEGRFVVGGTAAEFLETRMNGVLLRQIAARTGGKFFTARGADALPEAVAALRSFSPRRLELKTDVRLWNLGLLLAAVVFLFAVEWFIRKRSGMV
ncbi:MAG: hypothetical protein QHI48_08000 [Bacteroidota bacterium]|nr:hypothetical protein [Bacteroidota bacterium]